MELVRRAQSFGVASRKEPTLVGRLHFLAREVDFLSEIQNLHRLRSLACCFLMNPQGLRSCIVFDERDVSRADDLHVAPHSGLDATASLAVLNGLKKLTGSGLTSIMVIHQPRYSIFNLLDQVSSVPAPMTWVNAISQAATHAPAMQVLLLGAGGHQVFLGHASQALDYFEWRGFPLPPNVNPADHFLDCMQGQVRQSNSWHFVALPKIRAIHHSASVSSWDWPLTKAAKGYWKAHGPIDPLLLACRLHVMLTPTFSLRTWQDGIESGMG